MQKLSDSNEFRKFILYGLNEYRSVRIETITASQSFENPKDIKKAFHDFVYDLGFHKWGHMDVQFCIVVVRKQHIHGFLRKPYQTPQKIRELWQKSTGESSHIKVLTLRESTREDTVQMGKMISYFSEQAQKHDCSVEFYKSDTWGILTDKDRQNTLMQEQKKQLQEKDKKKIKSKGLKFDPVVMIDGKFYYESQLSQEQKDRLKGKKLTIEDINKQADLWKKAALNYEKVESDSKI